MYYNVIYSNVMQNQPLCENKRRRYALLPNWICNIYIHIIPFIPIICTIPFIPKLSRGGVPPLPHAAAAVRRKCRGGLPPSAAAVALGFLAGGG